MSRLVSVAICAIGAYIFHSIYSSHSDSASFAAESQQDRYHGTSGRTKLHRSSTSQKPSARSENAWGIVDSYRRRQQRLPQRSYKSMRAAYERLMAEGGARGIRQQILGNGAVAVRQQWESYGNNIWFMRQKPRDMHTNQPNLWFLHI